MRFRALLLVACMLVVPLLAMFSHHIPAEIRAAMRRNLRVTLADWLGRTAEAGPPTPVADRSGAQVATKIDRATSAVVATSAADPATAGLRPVAETASDPVVPPPSVTRLADRSRQARDQLSIESQLKDLGAVSFDCQPLPGGGGLHSSSCRVPVDASGQLQRVFQATGPDPVAASENLLQQIVAWRQRAAAARPPVVTAGAVEQAAPVRFR
jgi:hypothetical protein